jgi:hypothetical protein
MAAASLTPAWPSRQAKIKGVGFHYIAKSGFPLWFHYQKPAKFAENYSDQGEKSCKFFANYSR